MSVEFSSVNRNQTGSKTSAAICPIHHPKPGYRYVQPLRTQSCAPKKEAVASKYPLEGLSVYHLSYPGVDPITANQCRPPVITGTNNIKVPEGPLEARTVTNQSFVYTAQKPAVPIIPKSRHLMGAGPMQNVTTQRHDYTPKATEKATLMLPVPHMHPIQAKMAASSVTMESFMPVGRVEPPRSCKPNASYQVSEMPLECSTVQQLSYIKPKLPKKEILPWAMKGQYQQPQFPMDNNTIYNGSYVAPGVFEPISGTTVANPGLKCQCTTSATEDLY